MNTIKAFPQTAAYYNTTFNMMLYTMVPYFSIILSRDGLPSEDQINAAFDGISQRRYDYPASQRTSLEVRSKGVGFPGKVQQQISIDCHSTYLCSLKEANDFRCACASISSLLLSGNKHYSTNEVLKKVHSFICNHFQYKSSNSANDHASVNLLRTGEGVCQAIASLASVLLPFMGVPCLNIWGEGCDGFRWEKHLWNVVRDENGRWIHVDFTFGLHSAFLPSTKNRLSERIFMKNHRFDVNIHNSNQFDTSQRFIESLVSSKITLCPGNGKFVCADRILAINDNLVMLDQMADGRFAIRLTELYRLLGGGVEYIRNKDLLHLVLYNNQKYVANASRFFMHQDSFDIRILNELHIPYELDKGALNLHLL